MKNWFNWILKIGNIRTALEKVYITIKEGIVVMTSIKESLEKDKHTSKYVEELSKIITLCANINAVIAKILFVIGGNADTSVVVAKSSYTIKSVPVVDLDKSIRDLKDLVI